jgi:hypothetical protein
MQAERARLAGQFHARFIRRAAALPVVAGMTAGHQILPCGFAGAGARDHVVEREFARRHYPVAVLAGVAVAHQDVLAGERAGLVRNAAVFEQANDRGDAQVPAGGVHRVLRHLFGRGNALENKHQGAARGADIDGFVTRVQHEHGFLESAIGRHRSVYFLPLKYARHR